MENEAKIYKAINKALGLSSPESLANNAILLREVNAFREQAYKAWDFLSSLVEYNARIIPNSTDVPDILGDEIQVKYALMAYMERGIPDNMAILDVEGKELPINPSEFELSWLRVCEAMVLSDEPDKWHYKVTEAYRRVAGGISREPIPTAIQVQEAEERLAGLSTLLEVCLSFERVATFEDWGRLDVKALCTQESDKIRAKTEAKEALELYREVASELLASQCTAGATLEQASAPEVAGLQAKIKELEQALEASEAERAKLAEGLPPADSVWMINSNSGYQAKLAGALRIGVKYEVIVKGAGAYQYATKEGCPQELLACYLSDVSQMLKLSNRGGTNWAVWKRSIQGIPDSIRTKLRTDYSMSYVVKDTLDEIRKELNALK